jgi:6-pyruvoyltetrahydropterin/6-carboxytetrahydropterin synthase
MKVCLYSVRKLVSTAHVYNQPKWSTEENQFHFGSCYSKHGHGHNYEIDFSWSLPEDCIEATGAKQDALLEFEKLAEETMSDVCSLYDHHHISYTHPKFQMGGKIPTTENLTLQIWEEFCCAWNKHSAPAKEFALVPSGVTVWEMSDLAASFGRTPLFEFDESSKLIAIELNITLGVRKVPFSLRAQAPSSSVNVGDLFSVTRTLARKNEHLLALAIDVSRLIRAPVLLRDAISQCAYSNF